MSKQFFRVAAIVLGLTGFTSSSGNSGSASITLGEIEYRAEHEQDGADSPLKASIVAVDPRTETVVWRVAIHQGTSRETWLGGRSNPRVVSLAPFAQGLIASTDDGATFFVDPAARKARIVRDMRGGVCECPEHRRPLVGVVVPIHYGLARVHLQPTEPKGSDPGFDGPIEGGCCVMPEKAALVSYCPACRRAGR